MINSDRKILIIDDEDVIRECFGYYLEDQNFQVLNAENGKIGLEIIDKEKPGLVITDLRMPEVDGLDVLKYVKETYPEIPVIVISGANRLEDAVHALRLGAWDYLVKPLQDLSLLGLTAEKAFEKVYLLQENRNYRENLEALVAEKTAQLEKQNRALEISRRQIIGILSQAADYRDFETGNHFLRVSEISGCIARGMGFSNEEIQNIQLASPIHDIGKIGIPDSILMKNGKLTQHEWALMKNHCKYGKEILDSNKFINKFCCMNDTEENFNLADLQIEIIETAANIALSHHEYWNGEGYPLGIKGSDIPVEARITAVADVFDALRSPRPYKDPWSEEESIEYIKKRSGIQFDPEVVEVFMNNIDAIKSIRGNFKSDSV